MTDKPQSMEEQVACAIQAMAAGAAAKGLDSTKLLEVLYKSYTDRMLADNERIWRTGAIFVPAALALFVALGTLKHIYLWHVLSFGLSAIFLMWLWLVIAKNHRSFQQKIRGVA